MQLDTSLLSVSPIASASSVAIALSGGVDSVVLLHLALQSLRQEKIKSLRVIHIHHDLSSHADNWATFCYQLCQQWSIPCHIEKVKIANTRGKGIERVARETRYQVFRNYLKDSECLLMGHHQDDQAETVIFRALRGSDPFGLSAIPQLRTVGKGYLYRPLLNISRMNIKNYAEKHKLNWIEDDSNSHDYYDRNFIRRHVMPILINRWPHASRTLAEVAEQCTSSYHLLEEVAQQHLKYMEQTIDLPFLGAIRALYCPALKRVSRDHQYNLLKYWFRQQGYPTPGKESLKKIISDALLAERDKLPCIQCHGVKARRYNNWLLLDSKIFAPFSPETIEPGPDNSIFSLSNSVLECTLSMQPGGIAYHLKTMTVTSRAHIKTLVPFAIPGRKGRKSLKKWLNELKVPPWIRDYLPLLVQGNELIAIPGLLTNVIFSAENNESSWHFSWILPDKKPPENPAV